MEYDVKSWLKSRISMSTFVSSKCRNYNFFFITVYMALAEKSGKFIRLILLPKSFCSRCAFSRVCGDPNVIRVLSTTKMGLQNDSSSCHPENTPYVQVCVLLSLYIYNQQTLQVCEDQMNTILICLALLFGTIWRVNSRIYSREIRVYYNIQVRIISE